MSEIKKLPISALRVDGGTQARAGINKDAVEEYAVQYRNDVKMPPVITYHDGTDYWLADGFHRLEGASLAGLTEIEAEIRSGTRRDAILFAVGANAAHGLHRTNADKRSAVKLLLQDSEWVNWSDREISRQCAVSNHLVAEVRRETGNSPTIRSYTDGNGIERKMDVSNLSNQGEQKPAAQAEDQRKDDAEDQKWDVLATRLAKTLTSKGYKQVEYEDMITDVIAELRDENCRKSDDDILSRIEKEILAYRNHTGNHQDTGETPPPNPTPDPTQANAQDQMAANGSAGDAVQPQSPATETADQDIGKPEDETADESPRAKETPPSAGDPPQPSPVSYGRIKTSEFDAILSGACRPDCPCVTIEASDETELSQRIELAISKHGTRLVGADVSVILIRKGGAK